MAPGGAWARAALVMVVVIALDQGTKALVRANVALGDRDGIFPGVELVHVRNEGVAFSRFSGGGTVVAVIVGAALLALVAYFVTHLDKPLVWLPTGMLIGGALGNVIDRVRDGAVTDFIKLPAWPAFNVADISITFGVLVLLYVTERPRHAAASDA
jgi:signal peptidase II